MWIFQKSLRVVESPPDVVVNRGEAARFVARVSPCMPIPSVFWFFESSSPLHESDSYQLVDGEKYRLEITGEGVSTLTVVNVDVEDSGVYTMSASSSAGTVEVSAVLTVHGQWMCCMRLFTNNTFLTYLHQFSSMRSQIFLAHRPWLVLGWVTTGEDRMLLTWVHSSVLTCICDRSPVYIAVVMLSRT